jgi:hypothetical protein
MKNWMPAAIVWLCFLAALPPANASPITFAFTGQVTQIVDPGGILPGAGFVPAIADQINGTYTFDSDAPGSPLGAGVNNFTAFNSPFGMSFDIAGTIFAADPFGFIAINVFDNADLGSGEQDRYVVFTSPLDLPGLDVLQAIIEGATATNLDTITSTGLPLTPPDFSRFDLTNEFVVSFLSAGSLAFVVGRIESVEATQVPEPGTAALVGITGCLCLFRRHLKGWRHLRSRARVSNSR